MLSYSLITLTEISTNLEILPSLKAGLLFGAISVKFSFNFSVKFR